MSNKIYRGTDGIRSFRIWRLRIISGCLWTVLCFSFLTGQEIPPISTISTDAYDGGDKNWDFAEDKAGNIYVANTEAILIYNGMNWQKVYLPNHRTPRCLFLGPDDRIYAGGYETMGYVDRSDPSCPVFIEIGEDLLKGSEEEIWHISGDEHRMIFQSFAVLIFWEDGELKKHYPDENIMYGSGIGDHLYIPRIGGGIYDWNDEKTRTIATDSVPQNATVTGLVPHPEEGILISTLNHGLYHLTADENVSPVRNEFTEILSSAQINKIIRLSDGRYAVGTIQNGVYLTKDFQKEIYHVNKSNGLNNNTVLSLYETQNGNLLTGLDVGFNEWRINEPDLIYYDLDGQLGNIFAAVCFRDTFLIGTNQGVFFQNERGRFEMVPGSQGQVWCFQMVEDDLLCGHNTGTLLWKNGRFEKISDVTGGIHCQVLDSSYVLQSTYTGLILLGKKDRRWQVVHQVEGTDKLVDRFIYHNREIAGLHPHFGLVYYHLSADLAKVEFRRIYPEMESYRGSNRLALLLYEERIFIRAGRAFLEMSEAGELIPVPENMQHRIRKSVSEYQMIKPLIETSDIRRSVAYMPEEGLEVQSIEGGYIKLPAGDSVRTADKTKWNLDYLLVNGVRELYQSDKSLKLKPKETSLTLQLRYPAGSFRREESGQYRLAGYNSEWEDLPANGRLDFRQLRHGTYDFQIRSGEISEYSVLSFFIRPHWYESWPGWILYGLIVLFILGLLQRRNRKHLIRQKKKLEQEKEIALEAERMKAKTERLEHEVIYKSKMLANTAMTIVRKNEMLNELKEVIKTESVRSDSVKSIKNKTIKLIDRNMNSDESWEIFERNFAEVHKDFLERFQKTYPDISPGDLRLAAYIRMNMSSKEIAPLLQISVRSVENKRYRLRKKMGLDSTVNLSDHLMRF